MLSLQLTATTAVRADILTEADVIRLTRAHDPLVAVAAGSTALAEAAETRAGLYPNPMLGWEREPAPDSSSTSEIEESFLVTLPLELGGRRPAEQALARAEGHGAQAHAARTRSAATARALGAFYESLAAMREREIRARAVARLDEAARVVGRQNEEGMASGYERTRLELEAELAHSRLRQAETRARETRTLLALLLGAETSSLELRGELVPAATIPGTGAVVQRHQRVPSSDGAPAAPAPESTSREHIPPQSISEPGRKAATVPDSMLRGQKRPSLRHLAAAETEARAAQSAARWAWLPALSVSAGPHLSESGENRLGYVAGATLSIPLFSWGQELRAESSARELLTGAETRAAERSSRIEETRAQERLESAGAEITRLREETAGRLQLLERAVASGYREGERSVVELVDVQRARTEVERRLLELELTARQAEIALRAARGEFE